MSTSGQYDAGMNPGKQWPRITVVTPSYNQGQFLEETIVSVLSQGYPNLEYMVIDGGSTDESIDIIRKYESELTYWVSEPDCGQSDAINKGFERSTGDILAWLNSDDYYAPGALYRVAHEMTRIPASSVVYASSRFVNEVGAKGRTVAREPNLRELLTGKNMIPQPSAFIRRSCLDNVGYLNRSLHFVMDWEYWLRVLMVGRISFVDDEVWSYYRLYPASKTGSWPLEVDVEMRQMIAAIWRDAKPPELWEMYRAESLGKTSLICARRYYLVGDVAKTRHYLLQAVHECPHLAASRAWLALAGRTVMGMQRVDMTKRLVRKAQAIANFGKRRASI